MRPPFTIIDAPQRSPEWFRARLGRLTGSVAADMLRWLKPTSKGARAEESAARRDLRLRLALERITGQPEEEGFTNADMQRGIDLEPKAFSAYEEITGRLGHTSGFLSHNDLMVGCSLDGHVDDFAGILEFKCPKSFTHVGYLRAGVMPAAYIAQVTHNLWVTGAAWCDFLSFDDRLPDDLQTFLVRVEAKDLDLATYGEAARGFLAEVDAEVDALRRLKRG